jgi:hypothetical protein
VMKRLIFIVLLAALAMLSLSCSSNPTANVAPGSEAPTDSPPIDSLDAEAIRVVRADFERDAVKCEGSTYLLLEWTYQLSFWQFQGEFAYQPSPEVLSAADVANGYEWKGTVRPLCTSTYRVAIPCDAENAPCEPGERFLPWAPWRDCEPDSFAYYEASRRNGAWELTTSRSWGEGESLCTDTDPEEANKFCHEITCDTVNQVPDE